MYGRGCGHGRGCCRSDGGGCGHGDGRCGGSMSDGSMWWANEANICAQRLYLKADLMKPRYACLSVM